MPPASGVSAFSSARHMVTAISSLSFMLVSAEAALRALTPKEMLGLEGGFLGSYARPKILQRRDLSGGRSGRVPRGSLIAHVNAFVGCARRAQGSLRGRL